MDTRFLLQNIHRQDAKNFRGLDSHLAKLKVFKYVHVPLLLEQLPQNICGIYTLTGGILTGKTTLLKLWMAKLLADGIPSTAITFLSANLIDDYEDLIHLLQTQLKKQSATITQYILIDDLDYLRDWDKAIKFMAARGLLDHTLLMLTSADKTITKKLQALFPNRQSETKADFHLYPLTFHESVSLKYPHTQVAEIDLLKEFNDYLLHGGYPIAINDMATHGKILDETLKIYSDSLKQAMLRHSKQEHFLREILAASIEHYCRPITWNRLTQELSINHPKTISDYITLLESFDAMFVQSAFLEEKFKPAPKKARKLLFTDPFIFHAINAWLLHANQNAFETNIKPILNNPELCSKLVEACTVSHYRRYYPTFYIKAEGEIDLVYLYEQRFWPVVITWTNQLRPKDLKQILKYPNGKILTRALRSGIIEHIRTEPLPNAIWRLGTWNRK